MAFIRLADAPGVVGSGLRLGMCVKYKGEVHFFPSHGHADMRTAVKQAQISASPTAMAARNVYYLCNGGWVLRNVVDQPSPGGPISTVKGAIRDELQEDCRMEGAARAELRDPHAKPARSAEKSTLGQPEKKFDACGSEWSPTPKAAGVRG